MKKRILSIFIALFLALSLIGCGQDDQTSQDQNQETTSQVEDQEVKEDEKEASQTEDHEDENDDQAKTDEDHYPVTIESYNSNQELVSQTYEEAPSSVLCVYQNSIETMLALGLEDHIVASSGLDHEVKPELKDAFSQINYLEEFAPDKETVLMLEPDMILSWYSYFGEKMLGSEDFWHDRDIHTYISTNSGATDIRTLENEYMDIENLGKIFNVEDKANEIVDTIKDEVDKVQNHAQESGEAVEVMILEKLGDEITVYGDTSLGGDMVKSLGAKLISPEATAVGEEDIIELDPDVIFVVYMDRDDEDMAERSVAEFKENPALSSVDAISDDRVYPIALGEMYCSGIRTIDGIETFAKGIYPELYEE